MKKQIYLVRDKYNPYWVYVGATTHKNINDSLAKKWCEKTRKCKSSNLLLKAMRCSYREDWEIVKLHDYSEDWEELERLNIIAYDSYNNGLNSTASGAFESTPAHKAASANNLAQVQGLSVLVTSKPVLCSNGVTYSSTSEAARVLGIARPNISKALAGYRKSAGGFTWRFA
jgi:hypothetical protein